MSTDLALQCDHWACQRTAVKYVEPDADHNKMAGVGHGCCKEHCVPEPPHTCHANAAGQCLAWCCPLDKAGCPEVHDPIKVKVKEADLR